MFSPCTDLLRVAMFVFIVQYTGQSLRNKGSKNRSKQFIYMQMKATIDLLWTISRIFMLYRIF